MFDSGISAQSLIDRVISEADIALPLSKESYVSCLNAAEQLMYSELVQEHRRVAITPIPSATVLEITKLTPESGEAPPRFEDIVTIYHNDAQLIKTTRTSGPVFSDTWYKSGNDIGLNLSDTSGKLEILYYVRPALKTLNGSTVTGNVMVPPEFIEIVAARLRSEAYKLANEDSLAAKWVNDYNTQLEIFKVWLANRRVQFGM